VVVEETDLDLEDNDDDADNDAAVLDVVNPFKLLFFINVFLSRLINTPDYIS